tara:strand:+ start:21184 stop:21669 length:486 start_codon:yes stop_codon:yes gene_type:complete
MGSFASDELLEQEVFRSQGNGLVAYLRVVNYDAQGIPDTFVLRVKNNSANTNYSILLPTDQKLITGFVMVDENSSVISSNKPLPRGSYEYLASSHEIRELRPDAETEINLSSKNPIQESNIESSHEVYTRTSFRIPYRIDSQDEFEFIIAIFRSGKVVLDK